MEYLKITNFYPAVAYVLQNEGGLEINRDDAGLITNYGISLNFYRSAVKPDAVPDDIRHLSVEDAEKLYESQFWIKNRYGELEHQKLASKMLDLAVNCGSKEANLMLQRAIDKLMYGAVKADGVIGIKTIAAANAANQDALYSELIAQAKTYYDEVVAKHPIDEEFKTGWLNRLNSTPD